jgi:hypothetical protein
MSMTEELSLDEYIRRKKMGDQFSLLNHRRRERDIDEEELNNSLDQYIQDARVESSSSGSSTPQNTKKKESTGNGKFDRKSLRDNESDSDEEDNKTLVPDEDIEMADNTNEEAKDTLDDLFQFQTVESKYGIRVRSQQWRMLPENLVDRPEGVQRLECLPLDDDERYKRVHNGRIGKNNRCRTSSFSSNHSNFSKRSVGAFTSEAIRAQGKFVEKGSFTYKTGDRNGDGSVGIIGIERSKRITPPEPVVPQQQQQQAPSSLPPQISINVNMDGFWNGMKEATTKTPESEPAEGEDKLMFAAMNVLRLLQNQRNEKMQQNQMRQEVEEIQGRPLQSRGVAGVAYVDTQPQKTVPMYQRFV